MDIFVLPLIHYCQSGVWKLPQGGTGLRGFLAPFKGRSTSCSAYAGNGNGRNTYSARVDQDGDLYLTRTYWGQSFTCKNTSQCGEITFLGYGISVELLVDNGGEGGGSISRCTGIFPIN